MKKELSWYAFYENINGQRIEEYDIFEHGFFYDSVMTDYKENSDDKIAFFERLKSELSYYFWSKSEWEVMLDSIIPTEKMRPKKVSVYDQVMLNWDVFSEYVWNTLAS